VVTHCTRFCTSEKERNLSHKLSSSRIEETLAVTHQILSIAPTLFFSESIAIIFQSISCHFCDILYLSRAKEYSPLGNLEILDFTLHIQKDLDHSCNV
jgi:hypothetical protein